MRRAPSAWKACSGRSASMPPRDSSTTPEDADELMYYREDKQGQILEEGINEAGAFCSWLAAGDLVLESRRADGAVLYLLLDVRLPAHRRLHLGGRRHAGARLSDRWHRRPHDAGGRGAAAPGRSQPRDGVDDSELPFLRSDLRLRTGRHHPGRPAAHDRGAGECLLLHHLHERKLRSTRRCRPASRTAS